MRRTNEPAPDEGGLTDSISLILKELHLIQKEMASNKTEFEEILAMITQNIRSAADKDTIFSAKLPVRKLLNAWMAGLQRPSQRQGRQRQGEMLIPLGVMETRTSISKWRQKPYRKVSKWAVVASTLRH
jgi:hypothetical protein